MQLSAIKRKPTRRYGGDGQNAKWPNPPERIVVFTLPSPVGAPRDGYDADHQRQDVEEREKQIQKMNRKLWCAANFASRLDNGGDGTQVTHSSGRQFDENIIKTCATNFDTQNSRLSGECD